MIQQLNSFRRISLLITALGSTLSSRIPHFLARLEGAFLVLEMLSRFPHYRYLPFRLSWTPPLRHPKMAGILDEARLELYSMDLNLNLNLQFLTLHATPSCWSCITSGRTKPESYSSPPLSSVSLSAVSITCGQLRSKSIK